MEPVTTGQIYWGAVPFVVIQVIMVLLVIMFPSMVMHYKGTASTIDPNTIKIEGPQIGAAAAGSSARRRSKYEALAHAKNPGAFAPGLSL